MKWYDTSIGKMDGEDYAIIFVTTTDIEEGRLISDVLLEQKAASCVNIIGGVSSMYRWNGKINETQESFLLVKTKKVLVEKVVSIIKEVHSYEVPEIIALPVIGGSEDYFNWIDQEVSEDFDER